MVHTFDHCCVGLRCRAVPLSSYPTRYYSHSRFPNYGRRHPRFPYCDRRPSHYPLSSCRRTQSHIHGYYRSQPVTNSHTVSYRRSRSRPGCRQCRH